MLRRVSCISGFLVALALVSPALAGDFMDIRLSWVMADGNFLAGPGETQVNDPGLGIGHGTRLFFDNYETKYTGFETMGHLVLYKKAPAFFYNFGVEAALALSLHLIDGQTVALREQSSYIRMYYDLSGGVSDDENIELVLYPLSADRFRMGYSYKASWAGDGIFPLNNSLAPGAKLQANLGWGYAFAGFKTSEIRENIGDTEQTELVTNWAAMIGLGVDLSGFFIEAKGGYFTRGTFQHEGLRGRGIYTSGLSYQIGYRDGRPIGVSRDLQLLRNDPFIEQLFFVEDYDGGVSWVLKHEGSFLWQTLQDPDTFARTTDQFAWSFDLNFALKAGFWRLHLDLLAESLAFMLHEEPSFTPFQDFPAVAEVEPSVWVAAGVDYFFAGPRLTPGLKVGLHKPATYTIDNLNVGGAMFDGRRTVGVRDEFSRDILPVDEGFALIYAVKASLKWDYAEMLSVVAEFYYMWDDNQIVYVSDFVGLNVFSQFTDAHILGFNLAAQARF